MFASLARFYRRPVERGRIGDLEENCDVQTPKLYVKRESERFPNAKAAEGTWVRRTEGRSDRSEPGRHRPYGDR